MESATQCINRVAYENRYYPYNSKTFEGIYIPKTDGNRRELRVVLTSGRPLYCTDMLTYLLLIINYVKCRVTTARNFNLFLDLGNRPTHGWTEVPACL